MRLHIYQSVNEYVKEHISEGMFKKTVISAILTCNKVYV